MARETSHSRRPRTAKSGVRLNTYYSSGRPNSADSTKKPPGLKLKLSGWAGRTLKIVAVAGLLALLVYNLILAPSPEIKLSNSSYHGVEIYQRQAAKHLQN